MATYPLSVETHREKWLILIAKNSTNEDVSIPYFLVFALNRKIALTTCTPLVYSEQEVIWKRKILLSDLLYQVHMNEIEVPQTLFLHFFRITFSFVKLVTEIVLRNCYLKVVRKIFCFLDPWNILGLIIKLVLDCWNDYCSVSSKRLIKWYSSRNLKMFHE